jgi:hypothetical protein
MKVGIHTWTIMENAATVVLKIGVSVVTNKMHGLTYITGAP